MNPFSYFKDVFSGKIYKDNELIGSNAAKILKRISNLPEDDFIRNFIFIGTASADGLLKELIFSEEKDESGINIFKKEVSQLNPEKVFESFKIITGHYLTAFLSNEDNKDFLKSIHLTQEDLKNKIFRIFSYNEEDRQIFNELFELFQKNDAPRYFLRLYKFLTKKTFGSGDEDAFHSLFFSKMLVLSYQHFFDNLTSIIY